MNALYLHCLKIVEEYLMLFKPEDPFNRREAMQFQKFLCLLTALEMSAQRLQVIGFFSLKVVVLVFYMLILSRNSSGFLNTSVTSWMLFLIRLDMLRQQMAFLFQAMLVMLASSSMSMSGPTCWSTLINLLFHSGSIQEEQLPVSWFLHSFCSESDTVSTWIRACVKSLFPEKKVGSAQLRRIIPTTCFMNGWTIKGCERTLMYYLAMLMRSSVDVRWLDFTYI